MAAPLAMVSGPLRWPWAVVTPSATVSGALKSPAKPGFRLTMPVVRNMPVPLTSPELLKEAPAKVKV